MKLVKISILLQNFLKASVEYTVYYLTKYGRKQLLDTTLSKYLDQGGYLLQQWITKCNSKNDSGKMQNFIRSTRSNTTTSGSGATAFPHKGDSFTYIETSSANSGCENVFVCFERTDILEFNWWFYEVN